MVLKMIHLRDFTAVIDVARAGYRWVPSDAGAVLVAEGTDVRGYAPFTDRAALWRDFARLEPTQKAILDFADRYGPLRSDRSLSFFDWQFEIGRWGYAFRLWETIEAYKRNRKDIQVISRFVRWEKDPKKGDRQLFLLMPVGRDKSRWVPCGFGEERCEFKPGELLAPAQYCLEYAFNHQLHPELRDEEPKPIALLTAVPDTKRTLAFKMQLPNLIDVLWVQFAYAVMGEKEYGDCDICGSSFEVLGERGAKRFCSDACRIKSHRRNKKKVIELHRMGKPLKEISAEVGSPIATIKKWLNPSEEN